MRSPQRVCGRRLTRLGLSELCAEMAQERIRKVTSRWAGQGGEVGSFGPRWPQLRWSEVGIIWIYGRNIFPNASNKQAVSLTPLQRGYAILLLSPPDPSANLKASSSWAHSPHHGVRPWPPRPRGSAWSSGCASGQTSRRADQKGWERRSHVPFAGLCAPGPSRGLGAEQRQSE